MTNKGGGWAKESWDGKTLYYQKSGGLFARPPAGGPERQILNVVAGEGGFVPVKEGIYHLVRLPKEGARVHELRFLQFATGRIQALAKFEATGIIKLSVSPDQKTFLYSALVPESRGVDLMLIENFR